MTILVNALGIPEPSSAVVRRLREVHPGLGLLYTPHAGPQWAVTMAWAPDDRRQALAQSGAINPNRTYDIIGYLPMDCGPDEAPAYLTRMLRAANREAMPRVVEQVASHNAVAPATAAMEAAIAEVLDQSNPASQPKRRGRPPKAR